MDKYLNTKQGSLEESVLEIWKEAAIEEDFRMDGRTKAYKEHRARLEAARLRREGVKKSIQTEDDDPHADSAKSGGKEEYKKFFNAAMKKFGVSSPAELKGDKEKEFYNYIDKNWKGDHEEELEENAAVELQKKVAKGGMDKQMFQKSVDLLKSKKYDELKKHLKASDTEPREYVMSLIAKKEPATFKKMYGNQTGYYSLMNQNEELEDSPNAANSQHLCAKNVVHEEWGDGECIPTMHAEPDEEGNIGWYDVMFEHGLEKGVAINELKVTHSEMHHNHKKKKNDEEVDEGIVGKALKKVGKAALARVPGTAASKQRVIDKADKRMAQRKAKADKLKAKRDLDTKFKAAKGTLKTKKKASVFGAEYDPSVKESYEIGTDDYRKHTQSITPGQDVTDFQNFKVESMREALAKVWEKAGLDEKVEYVEYKFKNKNDAAKAKAMLDAVQLMSFDINDDDITNGELAVDAGNKDMTKYHKQIMQKFSPKVLTQENELEEYITKDGMRRRVAEGDKRRTENKNTGKGGKTMTGKTSDVINLKPTTEEVELDEVAPLVGMAAKALAKGALAAVGSKVAKKAMGEKMLAADYMIKSGKSPEEIANVANVDVEEVKKVMAAYHEDDEKHYKEYLAAMCNGGGYQDPTAGR